jgi:flagellar assembly protein FliH
MLNRIPNPGALPMSKVIRTVRIAGPVVTLGQLERELYLSEMDEAEGSAEVDLAGLLSSRVDHLGRELEARWQARLEEERRQLQEEAQRQLEATEAHWQQVVEQTREQRYREGFAAGVADREAEAQEAVERMAQVQGAIEAQRGQILREAEQLVVDLAVALARRVTGAQAAVDPRILLRAARGALEELGAQSELVLKVHPEDLNIARKFAQRWVERAGGDAALRVRPGEEVDRGGCLLEGEETHIDARLDTQLEALRLALRDALEKGREEDATGEPA